LKTEKDNSVWWIVVLIVSGLIALIFIVCCLVRRCSCTYSRKVHKASVQVMAAIEPPIIRFEIEEPPPTHADQHQEIQYIKRKKVVRERTHHGRDEIVCRREEDECVHCKAEEANKLLFTQMEVLRVQ